LGTTPPGIQDLEERRYRIGKLPSKISRFIRRQPKEIQRRIATAFDYILKSPFEHPNPTVIKPMRGQFRGCLRYRIDNIRFIYRVEKETRVISILEIDNRGDIY
jgi:mRNA interferase RelE/StbE